MGKIVTIGGVTPPSSLDLIDEEIIMLTNKKYPTILYVPTTGGDNLGYCEFYKGIYEGRFGCKMDVLFLINETPTENEIREKIFSSDIIYVGGGSSSKLLEILGRFNVINILKEAYDKGVVFVLDGEYRVIATKEEANAYKVYKKGKEIIREVILKEEDFKSVEELLN